jgi:hypothetical protein
MIRFDDPDEHDAKVLKINDNVRITRGVNFPKRVRIRWQFVFDSEALAKEFHSKVMRKRNA